MFSGGVFLLLTMSFAYAVEDYTGYVVISAQAKTAAEVDFLRNLEDAMDDTVDFWSYPLLGLPTDIMMAPDAVIKAKKVLDDAGIEYTISTSDVQRHIDIEKRSMGDEQTSAPRNITNAFLRYDEIVAFVYGIEAEFPGRVRVRRFGKSYEGRDLLEVMISSDLNSTKPSIYLEFTTHAREWISPSTALNLIQTLASGTEDGEAMLVNYNWYIAPLHNPDGYEYTHTDDRMWRKNRQRHNGCCVGLDLNRNWDSNFGGIGSSGFCSTNTFRGRKAFSAPETRALKKAIEETPNVIAFIGVHSYGQYILAPYGYSEVPTPDHAELIAVGTAMADAFRVLRGLEFTVQRSWDWYPSSGGSKDYWYNRGIKYSYTIELPPKTAKLGRFMPPASEIYPVAMETIAALKAFAELELGI